MANKFQNIKENSAGERIKTPLTLNRSTYHACFSYITNTAIRLVEDHYISLKRPFQTCTRVFIAITGLPCGHRVHEAKELRVSFLPGDFHPHWHWDRYIAPLEPLLEPLRVVSYSAGSSRTQNTRRLPSSFEATEERARRCGLCRQSGHTRASLQCLMNIQRVVQEHAPPLFQSTAPTMPSCP